MALPAIVGALAIDPVLDGLDLVVDASTLTLQLNQFVMSEVNTGAIMTLDVYLAICQQISGALEDWKDDSEISKIRNALYNPKVLNKLLGEALNFGSTPEVVEKVDSLWDMDFSSIPFLSWIDSIWDNTEGSSFPQDHFDFRKIYKFRDEGDTADLWMTEELAYINAKFGRRW